LKSVTNIAAYHFAHLTDLTELRRELLSRCREWDLKGTILLSPEGINLFVAGDGKKVDELLAFLRRIPGLAELTPKVSTSNEQPFRRMLVRLKKEIIAFGQPGIDPATYSSPRISPLELKEWLDQNRDIVLLDTRNDYEIKMGTFDNALPAGINHFRDFPEAVNQLPEKLKDQPVVTFCTGGIRCEKAAPFLEQAGFKQVFQLDGGILKYFEDVGGAHYHGECFVFDQRVGVDPELKETDSALCFGCQEPLTAEEQKSPLYHPPHQCPHCVERNAERTAKSLEDRQKAIDAAGSPLPGSTPYDNARPIEIPKERDGEPLLDVLDALITAVPREEWQARFAAGLIVTPLGLPLEPNHSAQGGSRVIVQHPQTVEPPVNAAIKILFEDEAIVVLNKPAPLPMHPSGRFNRNTLHYLLLKAFTPWRLRPAHRLDANTSGVVLCAKSRRFASLLQPQFENDEIDKVYLALVHGRPENDLFSCDAAISTEPGPAGSRTVDPINGAPAATEFTVLQRFERESLLKVHPLSGRTNQIRIHLWHLGFPIVGDETYQINGHLGTAQTLSPADPPMHLHCEQLTFTHPKTNKRSTFVAPSPWAKGL